MLVVSEGDSNSRITLPTDYLQVSLVIRPQHIRCNRFIMLVIQAFGAIA